jgi:hypothetical protein
MGKNLVTKISSALLLTSAVVLTGCSGGSGGGSVTVGGGGGSSTYGEYQSPSVTASQFVDALNYVDISGGSSYIELYTDEAYRSAIPGEDQWFVIYDDKFNEHKAVSLEYIRSIVYYDYMRDTDSLASEFRAIESDDIYAGDINGDFFGDDYEVVDYDSFTDSYWGRNSGFEYEDETETTDVNLIAAESQEMKFFKKASAVSYEFNVNVSTAMGLVTLGDKLTKMNASQEISAKDMEVLSKDLTTLTGVTANELMEAAFDEGAKVQALEKAAKKMGTTTSNIEQKLLPALGINI